MIVIFITIYAVILTHCYKIINIKFIIIQNIAKILNSRINLKTGTDLKPIPA
jgi:hypothetical protein